MNIKSLLLGSAAALAVVSGAQAADAVIAAEPEPMEYVKVCDAYGTGFFYIPGTETCLKVGGSLRYEKRFKEVGDAATTYDNHGRARLEVEARFTPGSASRATRSTTAVRLTDRALPTL